MIAIVISEKGGAERRDVFDHDEITVGRVKGNDVLLPKGNVSKQHARVIVRDGRYIVSDLKSTNGTYVNHRRITHATLVREGDRIYIGDFILRIDNSVTGETTPEESPTSSRAGRVAKEPTTADLGASLLDPATMSTSPSRSSAISATPGASEPNALPGIAQPFDGDVSHFPLENDPDGDDPSTPFAVPEPARLRRDAVATPRAPSAPSIPSSSTTGSFAALSHPVSSDPTPSARTSQLAIDEATRLANRDVVAGLVKHVEDALGTEDLDRLPRPTDEAVERALAELAGAAKLLSIGDGAGLAALTEAARRELLGLGPLDALVDDENISRIRVAQRGVNVQRRGQPSPHEGFDYGSERSVVRTIRRLCADAGKPIADGESVVERDLSGGRKLSALLAPAALDGAVLQIRRTRSEPVTLNALVRGGAVSRGMAMLLSQSMAVRANMLVVGPPDHGVDEVLSALCSCTSRSQNVLAIGEDDFGGRAVRLGSRVDDGKLTELVRAAARMAPDYLMSRPLVGEPLAALFDTISEGQAGVVLANPAATLRQAIERLAAEVAGARAIGVATARDSICNAFDLAIEVSRLRDGRLRVIRIAELKGAAPRDVFAFTYHRTAAGGSIEGSFAASGVIPRIVEDLAARGVPLDTAIFRRHPSG